MRAVQSFQESQSALLISFSIVISDLAYGGFHLQEDSSSKIGLWIQK
jgi:hypothetical protein